MSPEDRLAELERDHERLLDLLERAIAALEARAGIEPPPPRSASRPGCRTPLHHRRTRGGGREIQAPAPPAPVVCLFCLQVVADERDADLLERLQAHACPEGEQA